MNIFSALFYVAVGLLLSVAAGVAIMVWSVNSPYLTARWKGCGRRVFWFSLLFLLAAGMLELFFALILRFSPVAKSVVAFLSISMILVGVVEEGGKLLAVVVGTSQLRRVTSPLDLFSYGAISAGAFSVLENAMYSLSGQFNWGLGFTRSLLSTSVHICCTAVAVLGVLRWLETGKKRYVALHYVVSALIHGLYDLILTLFANNLALTVVFCLILLGMMIAMVVTALKAPGRFAKSHSIYVCPRCGWQARSFYFRCFQCGNPALLRIVELPRLTQNTPQKENEVQYEA